MTILVGRLNFSQNTTKVKDTHAIIGISSGLISEKAFSHLDKESLPKKTELVGKLGCLFRRHVVLDFAVAPDHLVGRLDFGGAGLRQFEGVAWLFHAFGRG